MTARSSKAIPPDVSRDSASGWAVVVAALLLLRWLVPTEGTEQGHTIWIALAWFATFTVRCWWLWRHQTWQTPKFHWADAGVGLLIGGEFLGDLLVVAQPGSGDRRAALNSLWEWIALGVTWTILRDVARSSEFRRLLNRTILISMVSLAALGIWQHFVWYPQQAHDLTELLALEERVNEHEILSSADLKRRQDLVEKMGNLPLSLDENGKRALLDRATQSVEPIGRFGLANSFAALLLLGVFLSIEEIFLRFRIGGRSLQKVLIILLTVLLIACLLLTKSRTAVIGLMVGGMMLAWHTRWLRGQWSNRSLVIAFGVPVAAILLLYALVSSGGLDKEVISEAPKSLRYRLEYWQATISLIRQESFFGVGAGNFRQHYLRFKLPGASEEVLDPHNIFLDAWANGGVIAFLGVCVLTLGWWGRCLHRRIEGTDQLVAVNAKSIFAVGVIAFGVSIAEAWLFEGYTDSILIALAATWFVVAMLVCWQLTDCGLRHVPLLAFGCALLTHLLGAGGLGMPAILQLLLIAIAVTNSQSAATITLRPMLLGSVSFASLAATVLCVWTTFLPVMTTRMLLEQALQPIGGSVSSRSTEKLLRQAAAADTLAPEPHQNLALLLAIRSRENPDDEQLFTAASEEFLAAIHRDPWAAKRYMSQAEWLYEMARLRSETRIAGLAVEMCSMGIQRYPEYAPLWALLARSEALAGKSPITAARKALQLDDLNRVNQHFDKLLSPLTKSELEKLVVSAGSPQN